MPSRRGSEVTSRSSRDGSDRVLARCRRCPTVTTSPAWDSDAMLPPDSHRLSDIKRRVDALGASASTWYREPSVRTDEDGFDVVEVAIVADSLVRPRGVAIGIS